MLLLLTPSGTADFWLTLAALLGLIGMQATYWLFTHPVNKFWLQGQRLSELGFNFFHSEQIAPGFRTKPVRTGPICVINGNTHMWPVQGLHLRV